MGNFSRFESGNFTLPHPNFGLDIQKSEARKPGGPRNYYSWAEHGQRGQHSTLMQANINRGEHNRLKEQEAIIKIANDQGLKSKGLTLRITDPATIEMPTSIAASVELILSEAGCSDDGAPPRK